MRAARKRLFKLIFDHANHKAWQYQENMQKYLSLGGSQMHMNLAKEHFWKAVAIWASYRK